MKIIQCSKGHHYDAEKFATCPHCNDVGDNTMPLPDVVPPTAGANVVNVRPIPVEIPTTNFVGSISADTPTEALKPVGVSADKETVTMPTNKHKNEPVQMEDEGKTISFKPISFADDISGNTNEVVPVVGWLVVIAGKDIGKSYNLKSGKNFIGRSTKMDVVLNDPTVSRERHAIVIYEPKQRIFIAQSGDASTLFYLNEEVVLSNVALKPYDRLQIGDSLLAFVPFCGDKFSWTEEVK